MIQPTVGRIVWFYPPANQLPEAHPGHPLAAIITAVWSDEMVNLAVFDGNGSSHSYTSVPLVQPEATAPGLPYCQWMPYQVKKEYGSESGEKEAGVTPI